jgi:hypothetical protein
VLNFESGVQDDFATGVSRGAAVAVDAEVGAELVAATGFEAGAGIGRAEGLDAGAGLGDGATAGGGSDAGSATGVSSNAGFVVAAEAAGADFAEAGSSCDRRPSARHPNASATTAATHGRLTDHGMGASRLRSTARL